MSARKIKNREFYFAASRPVIARVEIKNVKIGLDYPMVLNNPVGRVLPSSTSYVATRKGKRVKAKKKRRRRLSRLRRKARRSLARRFTPPVDNGLDLSENAAGGLRHPCGGNSTTRKRVTSKLARLVGDLASRKRLVKVVKRLLLDLGVPVIGPVPFMILEKIWVYFGEEYFAAHGRLCWCRLCRSGEALVDPFLASVGGMLVRYVLEMPIYAIYRAIIPAPLKFAAFLLKKGWQWYKALLC